MPELAVTVIGNDRPGIVAAVTEALAEVGGNLEDTTSTILRGHFSMTLVVDCARSAEEVAAALTGVAEALSLDTAVRPLPPLDAMPPAGEHHVLTLHGADRPGIVARVSRLVAAADGNITDLTTRLTGGLYVLLLEFDLPEGVDVAGLAADLAGLATELGVEASVHPADADLL